MALRIPIGYASVRMDFLRVAETDLKSIVFGVKLDSGIAGVAEDVKDAWASAGSLNSVTNAQLTLTQVTAYGGNDGPLVVDSWVGSLVGAGAALDLCSPAVSYVLKKRTTFAGNRYRGRLMLPWAEESQVSSAGVVLGAKVTAVSAAAETFRINLGVQPTLAPEGMVLLHDEALGALDPTPVTSLQCRGTVGTVRRRQIIG